MVVVGPAAGELVGAGRSVILFEARKRVGGRILGLGSHRIPVALAAQPEALRWTR